MAIIQELTNVSALTPAQGFFVGQEFLLEQGLGDLFGLFAQAWVVDMPGGYGPDLEFADHVLEGMAHFFGGAVHGQIER
ncbi:hypothetical protein D9M69_596150 [compost metagenome]